MHNFTQAKSDHPPKANRSQIVGKRSSFAALAFGAIAVSGCALEQVPWPSSAARDLPIETVSADVRNVQYGAAHFAGRNALKFALSDEEQARQRAGSGPNRPTFLVVAETLTEGTIEVDLAAEINGKGGQDARGFAGIAFNIVKDSATDGSSDERFEMVYLRMANGLLNSPLPPAPRNVRALQYGAYPDFDFAVSRERSPGVYEQGATIATGQWHRLRLDLCGSKVTAYVDGEKVLEVQSIRKGPRSGRIGLWTSDGSDAYAANLAVKPHRCAR